MEYRIESGDTLGVLYEAQSSVYKCPGYDSTTLELLLNITLKVTQESYCIISQCKRFIKKQISSLKGKCNHTKDLVKKQTSHLKN